MAGSIEGPRWFLDKMRVDLEGPLIPILLHRMQNYSHYTKGHVGCIVVPWQGPVKDQDDHKQKMNRGISFELKTVLNCNTDFYRT